MNIADEDIVGRWFVARKVNGVDSTMRIRMVDADGKLQEEIQLPHSEYDGMGALTTTFDERGIGYKGPANSREKRPVPLLKLLWDGAWRRPVSLQPTWKKLDSNAVASSGDFRSILLTEAETSAVHQEAKRRGITAVGMLLWAEHRMLLDELQTEDSKGGCWLIPVNLRGPLRLPRPTQNHASGLFLDIPRETTPEFIHEQMRQAMARGQHWWAWFVGLTMARMGQRFLNWAFPRMVVPGRYMGAFSMLGRWQVDWRGSGFPENTYLTVCGPGSPGFPVSNGVIEVNGRLSLSIRPDNVLQVDSEGYDRMLQVWKSNLLGLLS